MRRILPVAVVALLVLSTQFLAVAAGGKLELTSDNTRVTFVGSKPKGKHDGGFKKVSGSVENLAPGLSGTKINLEIQTESLYSDNAKLTKHLLTSDFFEVKAYPRATFKSTGIQAKKDGSNTHVITGDLTLRGVTKSISFPAAVKQGNNTLELTSDFTISKKDYGMTYGEGKIYDDVKIKVAINAK